MKRKISYPELPGNSTQHVVRMHFVISREDLMNTKEVNKEGIKRTDKMNEN